MYATCLFCHSPLGANEAIEHFPVGKRLAYDAAKGRLWVVCRKCERWNLSPLEERWEAIEEAERAYRDTRKRVATDNIGLARLRDGTDLIRIGAPLRPEFAAWRYGDRMARRYRKHLLLGGAGLAVGAGIFGGISMGAGSLFAGAAALYTHGSLLRSGWYFYGRKYRRIAVTANDGSNFKIAPDAARQVIVTAGDPEDPSAGLKLFVNSTGSKRPPVVQEIKHPDGTVQTFKNPFVNIEGEAAHKSLARILAATSGYAGSRNQVISALGLLERTTSPHQLLRSLPLDSYRLQWFPRRKINRQVSGVVALQTLPAHVRLALEMSLHEDSERRALEGELHELEHRWKEAEEIAAIADNMFLPGPSD